MDSKLLKEGLQKILETFDDKDCPYENYYREVLTEAIKRQTDYSHSELNDGLCADNPVLNEDGSLHQWTLKVEGEPYRCKCGCNVFHKPDKEKLKGQCCHKTPQQEIRMESWTLEVWITVSALLGLLVGSIITLVLCWQQWK